MALFKKTSIYTALWFLFLFSISTKMHSQKLYLQEQKLSPIVYRDTVILHSPALPVIFDKNLLTLKHRLTPECSLTKPLFPPFRLADHKLFADIYRKNTINRYAYNYVIKNNIRQIKYTTADFVGKVEPLKEIQPNIFQFLFKIDDDLYSDKVAKPERFHPKRRYWTYSGNHKIQLSQNYISQNWYKGGVKNFNLLNRHDLSFNYKNDKYQVNNIAEWRLYLYTNPNETLRYGSIGEDLVRTYSNFGIQAFNNWSYSSTIEIKTQLLKKFKENSDDAISSAFAPLYINIGFLGMSYQIEKVFPKVRGKKIKLTTDISPLSIKYIAVLNNEIDPKRFGIETGARHLTNFGSTVNAKLLFHFNKYVNFTSRFYYFTNCKTITAESENTLNMPINRFFSTSIYLFFRFDDNSKLTKDPTLGYFQINELISFGFNYVW